MEGTHTDLRARCWGRRGSCLGVFGAGLPVSEKAAGGGVGLRTRGALREQVRLGVAQIEDVEETSDDTQEVVEESSGKTPSTTPEFKD